MEASSGGSESVEDEDEMDVPEEIENILEGLFKGLQDRVSFSTSFHYPAYYNTNPTGHHCTLVSSKRRSPSASSQDQKRDIHRNAQSKAHNLAVSLVLY